MTAGAAPSPAGEERRGAEPGACRPLAQHLANVAHELRTPLNAIKTWAHVLEGHLDAADPVVRRALAGILLGVDGQVRVIETLLEGEAAEKLASRAPVTPPHSDEEDAMSKRKDAQPRTPGAQSAASGKPRPDENKAEMPGQRRGAKARDEALDKSTRRGER